MLKFKKVLAALMIPVFVLLATACEPPDNETIAKVIKAATAVSFEKIIDNNPELEDVFHRFAILNRQIIIDREIDVETAKRLMTDVLVNFKDLDPEAQSIILSLFNTIIPLIELPDEGVLQEPQKTFVIAFYNGIIQAVETRKAIKADEPEPTLSWEVHLFSETLRRL